MLNLYKLMREDAGYDEFIGFVVAANDKTEALILTCEYILNEEDYRLDYDTGLLEDWNIPEWFTAYKTIELIGITAEFKKPVVVFESYHHG